MPETQTAAAAGEAKPTAKQRRAAKQRREQWATYMRKHRGKLEKVIQAGVNNVLAKRPPDPWTALLEQLHEHTKEGLRFSHFRCWPSSSGGVCIEVVAHVRGANASPFRVELESAMLARGLASLAGEDPAEAEAAAAPAATLAAQFGAKLRGSLAGVHVLDLVELDNRLRTAFASSASELADDVPALRCELDSLVLSSVGRLMDGTVTQAVKASCAWRRLGTSPDLLSREDLPTWQRQWPELVLPVLEGATPRRRLCVGLTLWAATISSISPSDLGDEQLVPVDPKSLKARLQEAEEKGAMANALEAGYDDPDELPPPDPDEFCPPLNAMSLLTRLGTAVTSKVCSEGASIPAGEDFAAALEMFSKGVSEVVPGYVEAEEAAVAEALAADSAEATAVAGDEADADAGAVEERPISPSSSEMRAMQPVPVPLSVQLQRGSIYGVLFLDADEAFDPDAAQYTFGEGGEARSQEDLIEYYANLCKASPLLKVLVGPLSPRDSNYSAGLEQLREKLPAGLVVIGEPADAAGIAEDAETKEVVKPVSPAFSSPEPEDPKDDTWTSVGYIRDIKLSPVGMVAQYIKCPELFACRHGFYDFDGAPAYLSKLVSYVHVSLALPELSRRLLLPKGTADELREHVRPLDTQLRRLFAAIYRRKRPAESRNLAKSLTFPQFKYGLSELGYDGVDEFAEPLFKFLDTSNNGSISAPELGVLDNITGPASLNELDELRLFLCEKQARELEAAKESGEGAGDVSGTSPLKMLWRKMDRNGSGSVSYLEFRRALKKMRHPEASAPGSAKIQELFMALDIKNNGFITEDEFSVLNMLSSRFQLERVVRVREFLQERFGSLKSAFKAMDENRSGSLSEEEWMEVMAGSHGYPVHEDVRVCFQFLDKDGSLAVGSKEFEFLGTFDHEAFLKELQLFADHVFEQFGSIESAYEAFDKNPGLAKTRQSTANPGPRAAGLEPKEFLSGCKRSGWQGAYDPRMLYNYLDASHVGCVSLTEFRLLTDLDAAEVLEIAADLMHRAVASFKDFTIKFASMAPLEAVQTSHWAFLHEEIRAMTQDDGS